MRYSSCPNGRAVNVACCALRIFEAATICIARVICAVELTDRMRRRISRRLCTPGLSELRRGSLHLGVQRVVELRGPSNLCEQLGHAASEKGGELVPTASDAVHR